GRDHGDAGNLVLGHGLENLDDAAPHGEVVGGGHGRLAIGEPVVTGDLGPCRVAGAGLNPGPDRRSVQELQVVGGDEVADGEWEVSRESLGQGRLLALQDCAEVYGADALSAVLLRAFEALPHAAESLAGRAGHLHTSFGVS